MGRPLTLDMHRAGSQAAEPGSTDPAEEWYRAVSDRLASALLPWSTAEI